VQSPVFLKLGLRFEVARAHFSASLELGPSHEAARAQFPAPLKLGLRFEAVRPQFPVSLKRGPSHEAARAQFPAPLKLGLRFEAARAQFPVSLKRGPSYEGARGTARPATTYPQPPRNSTLRALKERFVPARLFDVDSQTELVWGSRGRRA